MPQRDLSYLIDIVQAEKQIQEFIRGNEVWNVVATSMPAIMKQIKTLIPSNH